jgi:hypothetical protein
MGRRHVTIGWGQAALGTVVREAPHGNPTVFFFLLFCFSFRLPAYPATPWPCPSASLTHLLFAVLCSLFSTSTMGEVHLLMAIRED